MLRAQGRCPEALRPCQLGRLHDAELRARLPLPCPPLSSPGSSCYPPACPAQNPPLSFPRRPSQAAQGDFTTLIPGNC